MFETFRKKRFQKAILERPGGKMLDQLALAVAVSELVGEYVRSRNGVSIVGDDNASVIETWRGIRLDVPSRD
jgi:hypothetical protein